MKVTLQIISPSPVCASCGGCEPMDDPIMRAADSTGRRRRKHRSGRNSMSNPSKQLAPSRVLVSGSPNTAMHARGSESPRLVIEAALREAQAALEGLVRSDEALASVEKAAALLIATFEHGGRVYSCGNGGSMSDAMHFAEELTGRYRNDRSGLPAQAISDVGHLTCVANDFGFDHVFSRYVLSHGRPGDCLFAISTSGKSPNVIEAAAAARARQMTVIALTGSAAAVLADLADVCIATPAGRFADRIQELHIKVIHILLELVERHFFPGNYLSAPAGS